MRKEMLTESYEKFVAAMENIYVSTMAKMLEKIEELQAIGEDCHKNGSANSQGDGARAIALNDVNGTTNEIQRHWNSSRRRIICHFCKRNHRVYDCWELHGLAVMERWREVKERGLCIGCLMPEAGHDCYARNCRHCDEFHNSLLCPRAPLLFGQHR